MKKLVVVCIALIALCGCAKPEAIDSSAEVSSGDIRIESKDKYVNFDIGAVPDDVYDENGEYTAEKYNEYKNGIKSFYDTLPLADVYLVQHNNGDDHNGRVNVHEDEELDMLIAEDGDGYSLYNDNMYIPSEYEELIHSFNTAGWHFCGALTGGAYDRLDFANNEYLLSAKRDKWFGLQFDNVELASDNIPLSLTIYISSDGAERLYIKYASLSTQRKELSAENIAMLENGLSFAGTENEDKLLKAFSEFIKSGYYDNADMPDIDISTIKPVRISDHVTQSGFIVDLQQSK